MNIAKKKRTTQVVLIIGLCSLNLILTGCTKKSSGTALTESEEKVADKVNDILMDNLETEFITREEQMFHEIEIAVMKAEEDRIAAEEAEKEATRIEAEKTILFTAREIIIEQPVASQATNQQSTYQQPTQPSGWGGQVLTPYLGVVQGPSGKETYYNLDMSGVISIMRSIGNNDPYWVRSDGCKMLGNYIMVAADLSIRPRGSLVQTSLGTGIVCDTGTFIYSDPYQIDIAVTW